MFLHSAASNSGSRKAIYIILILLLMISNAILFYYNLKGKQDKDKVQTELEAVSDEKSELQIEFNATIRELENMKEEVAEQDSSLVEMGELLEEQKSRIERLLSKNNVSKSELSQARDMIASLQANSDNYRNQIEQLKSANTELYAENQGLQEEVKREVSEKEQVMAEKSEVIDSKNQLEEEKSKLQSMFNRAAVLAADDIQGMGIKDKGDKESVTDNYKKADKLKVCFDLLPNKAAEKGKQEIAIRIMAPNGVALTNTSMGSGTMELAEEEKTVKYSLKKNLPYQQVKVNHCVYWEQDEKYIGGDYDVEIYHEGYKIGTSSFNLNKKIF